MTGGSWWLSLMGLCYLIEHSLAKWNDARGWRPLQAAARAYIRFMFQAIVTRLHSPWTWSRPRRRNWRKPITDLMMPNTGSGICLRKAYSFLPSGVCRRWLMAASGGGFSSAGGALL